VLLWAWLPWAPGGQDKLGLTPPVARIFNGAAAPSSSRKSPVIPIDLARRAGSRQYHAGQDATFPSGFGLGGLGLLL